MNAKTEERSIETILQGVTLDELLRTAYGLTHRMHACVQLGHRDEHVDLKAQRDLIDAEIARRCDVTETVTDFVRVCATDGWVSTRATARDVLRRIEGAR